MAQVTRREKKDGTVSYTIRVYSGRTQSDKVITRCKTVNAARRDGQEESREVGAGAGDAV